MKLLLATSICFLSACASLSTNNSVPLKLGWSNNTQKMVLDRGASLDVSGSLSSVVSAGPIVVYANTTNSVNAYNKKTGKLVWSNHHKGGASGLSVDSENAYYVSTQGKLYSVKLTSGETNWSVAFNHQSMPHSNIDSDILYVFTYKDQLYAINKKDGSKAWTYTHRSESNAINMLGGTQPVTNNNFAFVGTSDGYLIAIKKSDGLVAWKTQLNKNIKLNDLDATPLLSEGSLYINSYDGNLYALNATNGKTLWSTEAGGGYGASIKGDRIYFSNDKGEVLSANKKTGKEVVSLYKTKKGVTTKPVINDDHLLFTETQGSIVNLNLSDKSYSKYSTGLGIIADLIIDEESNIFAASKSAKIYSLKVKKEKELSW